MFLLSSLLLLLGARLGFGRPSQVPVLPTTPIASPIQTLDSVPSSYTPYGPTIKVQFTSPNQDGGFYILASDTDEFWKYTSDINQASVFTLDGPTQFLFMSTTDNHTYESGWRVPTVDLSAPSSSNGFISSQDGAYVASVDPTTSLLYGLQCSISDTLSTISRLMTCSSANAGLNSLSYERGYLVAYNSYQEKSPNAVCTNCIKLSTWAV